MARPERGPGEHRGEERQERGEGRRRGEPREPGPTVDGEASERSGGRASTVRKVRTKHGTRVARAIVCSACGQRDIIHFAPRDNEKALCRRCASDLLGVEDPDTAVGSLHPFVCATCKRPGTTQRRVTPGFVCNDCLRGIESKQGERARRGTRTAKGVVRVPRRPAE